MAPVHSKFLPKEDEEVSRIDVNLIKGLSGDHAFSFSMDGDETIADLYAKASRRADVSGNFVLVPVSDASGLDPTSPLDILSNAEPLRRVLEGTSMELQLSVHQPPNVIMDTEEFELRARMRLGWTKC